MAIFGGKCWSGFENNGSDPDPDTKKDTVTAPQHFKYTYKKVT